jgi:hypothetical protein
MKMKLTSGRNSASSLRLETEPEGLLNIHVETEAASEVEYIKQG